MEKKLQINVFNLNKSEIKLKFMINVKFKMHSQTCPIKKTIIKGLNFQIYNNNYIKKKKLIVKKAMGKLKL